MKFEINENGIVCNKCHGRELNWYKHKTEKIGHLQCPWCNNLVPMHVNDYAKIMCKSLEIYERGENETEIVMV